MRQTKALHGHSYFVIWSLTALTILFVFIALKRVVLVVLKGTISILYNVFSAKQYCHFYFSHGSLIISEQVDGKVLS